MIINTELKFVFLAMPHTASRATHAALLELRGSTAGEPDMGHHAHLRTARRRYPDLNFDEFLVFTTVRHPGDWLVTRWLSRGGVVISFSDFLRTQKAHIFGRFHDADTEQLTRGLQFIKYESIEDDIRRLLGVDVKLGLNPKHVTKDKCPWLNYWNKSDARFANGYFQDFEKYQYEPVTTEAIGVLPWTEDNRQKPSIRHTGRRPK